MPGIRGKNDDMANTAPGLPNIYESDARRRIKGAW